MCPGAWACAPASVCVALPIQHAMRVCNIMTSFVAPPHFLTLSHKRREFRKKLRNIKCVFEFSLQILSKTFLILRRVQRDTVINAKSLHVKYLLFLLDFN